MGLGGTAKKLQRVVDVADELYAKVTDLREELVAVRNSIDETKDRVAGVEDQLDEQRVLLERLAEAEGVDTDIDSVTETQAEPTTQTDSETDRESAADDDGEA